MATDAAALFNGGGGGSSRSKQYHATYSTSQEDGDEGYRTQETTFEAIDPLKDTNNRGHRGCNGSAAHMVGAPDLLSNVVGNVTSSPFPSPRRPLLVPAQSIESSSSYESQSPPPQPLANRRGSRGILMQQRRNSLRWLCNNKLISNKRAGSSAAAAAALTSNCGPSPVGGGLTVSTPVLARSNAFSTSIDVEEDSGNGDLLEARLPGMLGKDRKRVSISQGGRLNQPDLATIPSYDPTNENLLGFADLLQIEKGRSLAVSEKVFFRSFLWAVTNYSGRDPSRIH